MSGQRPFPNDEKLIRETTSLLKPTGVISHSILTTDLIKDHSKNKGILYKNDSSIFDFEKLAENLRKQSKEIHDDFYDPPEIDKSYFKTIDLSDDNNNFVNVFQKFRGCLEKKYREAFADEFAKLPSLTVGTNTYDVAHLKTPSSATLPSPTKYVDMTNSADVKIMIEMLESMKNKTLEVLKDPAAASAAAAPASSTTSSSSSSSTAPASSTTTAAAASSTAPASTASTSSSSTSTSSTTAAPAATPPPNFSSLSYNDKDINTINKDDLENWSAKEIGILEEPQNHENVLYVIGQVFNIIAPTHYESFLTEKPSSASSASSLSSISKTNFFQFIKKDPASNITSISKDGALYVGQTNGDKKYGEGMMRWANGSIFEGEFANDSIKINEDGIFNGKPLKITDANTGEAVFDGVDGTFNMVTGEFTPTGAVAGAATGATGATGAVAAP
jgi:hypothetical protein